MAANLEVPSTAGYSLNVRHRGETDKDLLPIDLPSTAAVANTPVGRSIFNVILCQIKNFADINFYKYVQNVHASSKKAIILPSGSAT